MRDKGERKMKYETPAMEIVALSADTAVANEVSASMGDLMSKNSTP